MSDAGPTIETIEEASGGGHFAITGDDADRVPYLLGLALGVARQHRTERDTWRARVNELEAVVETQATELEGFRQTFGADLMGQLDAAEAERDRLRVALNDALGVLRPMTDSACDADVLLVADLYRIVTAALDGTGVMGGAAPEEAAPGPEASPGQPNRRAASWRGFLSTFDLSGETMMGEPLLDVDATGGAPADPTVSSGVGGGEHPRTSSPITDARRGGDWETAGLVDLADGMLADDEMRTEPSMCPACSAEVTVWAWRDDMGIGYQPVARPQLRLVGTEPLDEESQDEQPDENMQASLLPGRQVDPEGVLADDAPSGEGGTSDGGPSGSGEAPARGKVGPGVGDAEGHRKLLEFVPDDEPGGGKIITHDREAALHSLQDEVGGETSAGGGDEVTDRLLLEVTSEYLRTTIEDIARTAGISPTDEDGAPKANGNLVQEIMDWIESSLGSGAGG